MLKYFTILKMAQLGFLSLLLSLLFHTIELYILYLVIYLSYHIIYSFLNQKAAKRHIYDFKHQFPYSHNVVISSFTCVPHSLQ